MIQNISWFHEAWYHSELCNLSTENDHLKYYYSIIWDSSIARYKEFIRTSARTTKERHTVGPLQQERIFAGNKGMK